MAVSTPAVEQLTDLELMAHLFRRAGFGATRDELEAAVARGYEATVDELVHPERMPELDEDVLYRFYPEFYEGREPPVTQAHWVYRMINTPRPLEEKMTLFWHCLFATGSEKSAHAKVSYKQIEMLRRHCLDKFGTILVELSKDPAMIFWLDNQENTNKVHNENYGRELLELFSMGVGNYTEDDVKSCARAFTGWGLANIVNGGPFGRNFWQFKFYPELHDYGEKEFLGERGNFDGTDVIEIIVRQPATARFIAKRLYLFFVSDTPDQAAIESLARAYQESGHDIRAAMRALLLSDFFRSEAAYYAKVKSPAELVVGVTRLVGDFDRPTYGIVELAQECRYMGQELMNPPSVEGWHTGQEWIDTGILVDRVNFAAARVGDVDKPGIRKLLARLRAEGELTPEQLVDRCLDLIGPLPVMASTREALRQFASKDGPLNLSVDDGGASERRVGKLLALIVATREFQMV